MNARDRTRLFRNPTQKKAVLLLAAVGSAGLVAWLTPDRGGDLGAARGETVAVLLSLFAVGLAIRVFARLYEEARNQRSGSTMTREEIESERGEVGASAISRARWPAAQSTSLRLAGVDLRDADLREVDLSGAELARARLDGADLGGANLAGADLRGARLTDANLRRAKLEGAHYDKSTVWPPSILPHETGAEDVGSLR